MQSKRKLCLDKKKKKVEDKRQRKLKYEMTTKKNMLAKLADKMGSVAAARREMARLEKEDEARKERDRKEKERKRKHDMEEQLQKRKARAWEEDDKDWLNAYEQHRYNANPSEAELLAFMEEHDYIIPVRGGSYAFLPASRSVTESRVRGLLASRRILCMTA